MERWIPRAVFAALITLALAAVTHAAIFDDGNDRKRVKELRAKDSSTLTPEEKAILGATGKLGSIGVCGGKLGGNAFLIRLRGRDVVVTSAHMMMDRHGALDCEIGKLSARQASFYMPNTSYYEAEKPDKDRDFIFRKVELLWPPLNWDAIRNGYNDFEHDFAMFYLTEPLSGDRMLDGSERGALDFSTLPIEGDKLFMVGLAKDFSNGLEIVYQKDCKMEFLGKTFYHGCDTLKGSSASLLATFEGDSLSFRGLHTSGTEDVDLPVEKLRILPNVGTSADNIRSFLEEQASSPNPAFLAYDIQWALGRTGCYSGKLDNQWGPGSRKALAAFASAIGVTLPGTDPSAELLAAIEKATPEGAKVCR